MLGNVSAASSSLPRERGSHGSPPTSSNPVAERKVVEAGALLGAKAEVDAASAAARARESLAIFVRFYLKSREGPLLRLGSLSSHIKPVVELANVGR